jgi:hypothetical protein
MKPWTAVAQFVDPILAELLAARPLLVPLPGPGAWIRQIPFEELDQCDWHCKSLYSARQPLVTPLGEDLRAVPTNELAEWRLQKTANQLAFRMMFACDVARRWPYMRKGWTWSGELPRDLEEVLVHGWYKNGLCWSYRRYG